MFSLTRSTTASWPQTSENRVLMSSGKYTSMPPLDRNQKMATNWITAMNMKNTTCRSRGIADQMVPGSSNRARIGDLSLAAPRMMARTAISASHLPARAIRNRVQSLSLPDFFSSPPKTLFCQNWW